MNLGSVDASAVKSEQDAVEASTPWTQQHATHDKSANPVSHTKSKRKAKRFLWTDDLHLRFVSAVFELGVRNASPKSLLALMGSEGATEALTTEHIKSHLQKYRINYKHSRLEAHKLNDKHDKRSFKRHRRHMPHREDGSAIARGITTAKLIVDESNQVAHGKTSADATLLRDTDQQMSLCDALLLEDETAQHMQLTMQQRMDFHRELLLTRSVEVVSGRCKSGNMDNVDATGFDSSAFSNSNNYYEQKALVRPDTNLGQPWVNTGQLQQRETRLYGRIHQQQQNVFLPQPNSLSQRQDAMPVAPFSTGDPQPAMPSENTGADGGIDLASWGRLSLTVDHDEDDVFGFLE